MKKKQSRPRSDATECNIWSGSPLFVRYQAVLRHITGPQGFKTFFMLNSAEHEVFSANKYENAKNSLAFLYLLAEKFSCSVMFSKKEFAIISNLGFISRTKFMLSWVEHEKNFMTLGPDSKRELHNFEYPVLINEHPECMFLWRNKTNNSIFWLKKKTTTTKKQTNT